MSNQNATIGPDEIEAFCNDPLSMEGYSTEQIFSMSREQVDRVQLSGLQRRLAELVQKLPRLRKLANANRISSINDINDIVPLLYPHTEYKSYPLSLIDNCQFEHLNAWLNDHTTHDLSKLDVSGCQSLDEWLDVVEANTPVRVLTSSGTSGKISLLPRSTLEDKYAASALAFSFSKYRDESGPKQAFGPDVYYVWPFNRYGRHSTAMAIRVVIEHGFGGDESHVLTLGGKMSTDILWMTGRLKKAEIDGTTAQLKKTKAWQRLSQKLSETEASNALTNEEFYKDVLTRLKDKSVVFVFGLTYYWAMIECAEKYGLEIRFAPDSFLNVAGGMKWAASLSQSQKEKIRTSIPHYLNEIYGVSEILNGAARKCQHGNYHVPPWLVSFVLDPDTGVPYPRKGVQTGRYAGFDLWALSYWAGLITGDEVTMNWDGGCACGRSGPYLNDKITRYTDKRGGDDKITCQRTTSAVEEMMDHFNQT